jgi:hypothetical protein
MALYQVFVASGAKLPDEGDQQEEFLGSIAAQLPTEKQLRRAVRRLRPSKKGPRSDEEKMADVATRFLEAQERDPQRALREMELQYFRDGRMDKDGRSIPYTKVRNWVHQATEDGWLTGQGQGKRGKVPGPKLLEYAERNRPTERKG